MGLRGNLSSPNRGQRPLLRGRLTGCRVTLPNPTETRLQGHVTHGRQHDAEGNHDHAAEAHPLTSVSNSAYPLSVPRDPGDVKALMPKSSQRSPQLRHREQHSCVAIQRWLGLPRPYGARSDGRYTPPPPSRAPPRSYLQLRTCARVEPPDQLLGLDPRQCVWVDFDHSPQCARWPGRANMLPSRAPPPTAHSRARRSFLPPPPMIQAHRGQAEVLVYRPLGLAQVPSRGHPVRKPLR